MWDVMEGDLFQMYDGLLLKRVQFEREPMGQVRFEGRPGPLQIWGGRPHRPLRVIPPTIWQHASSLSAVDASGFPLRGYPNFISDQQQNPARCCAHILCNHKIEVALVGFCVSLRHKKGQKVRASSGNQHERWGVCLVGAAAMPAPESGCSQAGRAAQGTPGPPLSSASTSSAAWEAARSAPPTRNQPLECFASGCIITLQRKALDTTSCLLSKLTLQSRTCACPIRG